MVMINRSAVLAVLLTSTHQVSVEAFSVNGRVSAPARPFATSLKSTPEDGAVDVSVPYNAAAKLAYDEWKKTYGGNADGSFENFEKNYCAATVSNIIAKKAGNADATVELDEKADLPTDADVETKSVTSTSIMNQAFESSMKQSEASSALNEAVDALAEEEAKLAEELGVSIEDLEDAVDAMSGISSEGIELEGTDIAREAKIRSEYMAWAKKFGKEQSEERFQIFNSNYAEMEEYSRTEGKAMELNQYADMTVKEFETDNVPVAALEPEVEKEEKVNEEAEVVAEATEPEPVTEAVDEETKPEVEEEPISAPEPETVMDAEPEAEPVVIEAKTTEPVVQEEKSKFSIPSINVEMPKIAFDAFDPASIKEASDARKAATEAERAELQKIREEQAKKAEEMTAARKEALEAAKAARKVEAADTAKKVEEEKKKRQAEQEKILAKQAADAEAVAIAAVS